MIGLNLLRHLSGISKHGEIQFKSLSAAWLGHRDNWYVTGSYSRTLRATSMLLALKEEPKLHTHKEIIIKHFKSYIKHVKSSKVKGIK